MNTEVTTDKIRFEIALTKDDFNDLRDLAIADKRSTKNYIELIVERHLYKARAKLVAKKPKND